MISAVEAKRKYRWMAYLAIVIFLSCLAANMYSGRENLNDRFIWLGVSLTRFAINSTCSAFGMMILCVYNFLASPSKALRYFYIALFGGAIYFLWQSAQVFHLAN